MALADFFQDKGHRNAVSLGHKINPVILVDSRVGRLYYRVLLASVQPTLPTFCKSDMLPFPTA